MGCVCLFIHTRVRQLCHIQKRQHFIKLTNSSCSQLHIGWRENKFGTSCPDLSGLRFVHGLMSPLTACIKYVRPKFLFSEARKEQKGGKTVKRGTYEHLGVVKTQHMELSSSKWCWVGLHLLFQKTGLSTLSLTFLLISRGYSQEIRAPHPWAP